MAPIRSFFWRDIRIVCAFRVMSSAEQKLGASQELALAAVEALMRLAPTSRREEQDAATCFQKKLSSSPREILSSVVLLPPSDLEFAKKLGTTKHKRRQANKRRQDFHFTLRFLWLAKFPLQPATTTMKRGE